MHEVNRWSSGKLPTAANRRSGGVPRRGVGGSRAADVRLDGQQASRRLGKRPQDKDCLLPTLLLPADTDTAGFMKQVWEAREFVQPCHVM